MDSKNKVHATRDAGTPRSRRRKVHPNPGRPRTASPAPRSAAQAPDEPANRGYLEPELIESDATAADDIERC